jgi:ZIP family zinc transporter
VLFALGLTLFAGLSTGIGSAVAFFTRKLNRRFLAGSLGFSAGVMIYVSLVEIFGKARAALAAAHGERGGYALTVASFFGGIALIALIDKLVPSFENPHELGAAADPPSAPRGMAPKGPGPAQPPEGRALLRMGVFSALAIAIHNFPEGLATFVAGLQKPTLAVSIAVAIAIHNIPEGIAVSAPIYYATGSRRRAFGLSFLSGLAEVVGALIGYFVLYRFFSDTVFGVVFGVVAGIMVYISLDELLPTAEKFGEHHVAIYGLIAGMVVMAGSLLLFA